MYVIPSTTAVASREIEYLTISLYIHKIAIIGIMFNKLYYTTEITCMISHAKYAP